MAFNNYITVAMVSTTGLLIAVVMLLTSIIICVSILACCRRTEVSTACLAFTLLLISLAGVIHVASELINEYLQ